MLFIVFNRLDSTRQVFARIREARPAHLLIVADGPRNDRPGEAAVCEKVLRTVLDGIDWPCRIDTDISTRNLGCGRRIFSGLQWAFTLVESAIILEDDCVPAPTFFPYCDQMLERYRNEPSVMMVGGTNVSATANRSSNQYLFSQHSLIWGWATWRRAIAGHSQEMGWWRRTVHPREVRQRALNWKEALFIIEWFDAHLHDPLRGWDCQWFAQLYLNRGLCVVPRANLISNVGLIGASTRHRNRNHLLPLGEMTFPLEDTPLVRDKAYDLEFVERARLFGGWIFGRIAAKAFRSPAGWLLRRLWHTISRRPRGR